MSGPYDVEVRPGRRGTRIHLAADARAELNAADGDAIAVRVDGHSFVGELRGDAIVLPTAGLAAFECVTHVFVRRVL